MLKEKPKKRSGGKISNYYTDMPQEMIDWFERPYVGEEKLPNKLPTIEGFANYMQMPKSTIYNYINKYEEMKDAYHICKDFQKDMLNYLSLIGYYNAGYAKFMAINCTDMKEKIVTEHQGEQRILLDKYDQEY